LSEHERLGLRAKLLSGFRERGLGFISAIIILTFVIAGVSLRYQQVAIEEMERDPLAIYKPTGAKEVDAAKAMANFKNWSYAAVNAIASEVANIQFRLYQINGDDHEELDDHPLLTLLDGVNEHMTGIELKCVTMAHLELAGNAYWLLDGVKNDTDQPRAIYVLNRSQCRSVPRANDHGPGGWPSCIRPATGSPRTRPSGSCVVTAQQSCARMAVASTARGQAAALRRER
jgi:hypothetical protein